ncbi:MAG: hypothetical protein ACE5K2_01855, partial [Candidatus Zixiibacteriota bacterium]
NQKQNKISQKTYQDRIHLFLPFFATYDIEYDGYYEKNNWWCDHPEHSPKRHRHPSSKKFM